jgi:hypothetical protein
MRASEDVRLPTFYFTELLALAQMLVYAPVKDEDNVLFKALEKGMEPLVAYSNTKNAPKNFFFPQTETMMRYTRTEKGMEFSGEDGETQEAIFFGVRPCDVLSFLTRSLTRRNTKILIT